MDIVKKGDKYIVTIYRGELLHAEPDHATNAAIFLFLYLFLLFSPIILDIVSAITGDPFTALFFTFAVLISFIPILMSISDKKGKTYHLNINHVVYAIEHGKTILCRGPGRATGEIKFEKARVKNVELIEDRRRYKKYAITVE